MGRGTGKQTAIVTVPAKNGKGGEGKAEGGRRKVPGSAILHARVLRLVQ